ncbi:MAG TPA: TonB-dependent receptor plug domain-containing protein [Steroidobacteraceae bacterium]|nr:TonB-dependent receptor plug domain-containing protein [Steroidobacteraceae bacterium]
MSAAALIGIAMAGLSAVAMAQEPAGGEKVIQALEEVTVTAQRREEAAQTVPLAITALSAEMLERQQIRSIAQLDQVVPNIVMNENTGTSSASKIFLRGVGEDESFFTADTPVGIYVDDVYIARQTGAMFDLFDAPRFEVRDVALGAENGFILWTFDDGARQGQPMRFDGTSTLFLDTGGRVAAHVDHWDAAGAVHARVPLLGGAIRLVNRRIAAKVRKATG